MNIPPVKTKNLYWKIPVVMLFAVLARVEISFHSEHWNSLVDGLLFIFSDKNDMERLELIQTTCLFSTLILSVLFLLIRNKISNIALITLMIIHLFLVLPCNYIKDPTMSF